MKTEKQIAIDIAKKKYEIEKLEIQLAYYEHKPKKETKIWFNIK